MTVRRRPILRNGGGQALAALSAGIANVLVISLPTWGEAQTAGRLAIAAVAMFAVALAIGSGPLVTATSLPMLGAGFISLIGEDPPAWPRAVVVGVVWYVAAELAWDAIERRDGVRRTPAHNQRRLDEVTRVVALSIAVSVVAITLTTLAPTRSIVTSATALLAMAVTFVVIAGRLRRTGGDPNT